MPECFTLDELRTLPDMGSAEVSAVDAAEAHLVDIVEEEIGGPLVPRAVTATFDGGGTALVLPSQHVRSLTSVTVNGTSLDVSDFVTTHGILRYAAAGTTFASGVSNVVVVFQSGEWAACPPGFKEPLLWAVRDRLLSHDGNSGLDARRSSVQTEFGTTTYVLPGEKRPTGFPQLDAAIAAYQRKRPGGFA